LYLIDECDVEPQGWRPYELLLTPLNARVDRGTQVTFVMAGSSGTNAAEMMQRMSTRVKSGDLLDRIPIENRYEIAPFSLGDRLLVVLSQFWLAAHKRGRIVREVEKFALYYVACNQHLENARQLQEFAARVIDRMPDGEDRAQYDYLFNAGNQRGLSSGGKQNGSTTASGENL
jgi:hypothetical protein